MVCYYHTDYAGWIEIAVPSNIGVGDKFNGGIITKGQRLTVVEITSHTITTRNKNGYTTTLLRYDPSATTSQLDRRGTRYKKVS